MGLPRCASRGLTDEKASLMLALIVGQQFYALLKDFEHLFFPQRLSFLVEFFVSSLLLITAYYTEQGHKLSFSKD